MVDMETKLNDMKSKSEEYTDKVTHYFKYFFLVIMFDVV